MKLNRSHALSIGLAATVVVVGGTALLQVRQAAARQLPGVVRSELSQLLGRPVNFTRLELAGDGVKLFDVSTPRREGEANDPFAARSISAKADWFSLLRGGPVTVSAVEVDRPVIYVATAAGATAEWTAPLARAGDSGLKRVTLRDGSVISTAPANAWKLRGVNGELHFSEDTFRLAAGAERLIHPQAPLTSLVMEGDGLEGRFQLTKASATHHGVRVHGDGSWVDAGQRLTLRLKGEEIPVEQLKRYVRLPAGFTQGAQLGADLVIEVAARELQSATGQLHARRTGGSSIPWSTASARVEWTEERLSVGSISMNAPGVLLTGDAAFGSGEQPLKADYSASGLLQIENPTGLATAREILGAAGLKAPGLELTSGSFRFDLQGRGDAVADSRVSGTFTAAGLRADTGMGGPVTFEQVSGALKRTSKGIEIRDIVGRTGVARLTGRVSAPEGSPMTARLALSAPDLRAVRQAAPGLSVWRWLPVMDNNSSARLTATLTGDPSDVKSWSVAGNFATGRLRVAARTSLPGDVMLFVPIASLTGDYVYAGHRLTLDGVKMDGDAFDLNGRVSFDYNEPSALMTADLDVTAADWRDLPAVPPTVLPEVRGGAFKGSIRLSERVSRLAQAAVTGKFSVTGAELATHSEQAPLPLKRVSSSFTWKDSALDLPSLELVSDLGSARARGAITRSADAAGEYLVALDITAESDQAGELAERLLDSRVLTGGRGELQARFEAPVRAADEGRLNGSLTITGGRLAHGQELLPSSETDIRRLNVKFNQTGRNWDFSRVVIDTADFDGNFSGSVRGDLLAADGSLTAPRLRLPESWPVSGGEWTWKGRLTVAPEIPANATGQLRGRGVTARLAAGKSGQVELKGDVVVDGAGVLDKPLEWAHHLDVLKAAGSARQGATDLKVSLLSGKAVRAGAGWRVEGLRAEAEGLKLLGSGAWDPKQWSLQVAGAQLDTTRLASLLKLPVKSGRLVFRGNVGQAAGASLVASGTLEGTNLQLDRSRREFKSAPLITTASARIEWKDEHLAVERLAAQARDLAAEGKGAWSRAGASFEGSLSGVNVSALGLKLPAGLKGGAWRLAGKFDSRGKKLAGSGDLILASLDLPFRGDTHRLTDLASRFVVDGRDLSMLDIRAAGPLGVLTGVGSLKGSVYRLALTAERIDESFIAAKIPGKLSGAAYGATLALTGLTGRPGIEMIGALTVTGGTYQVPRELGLNPVVLTLKSATADYRVVGEELRLAGVKLDSDLLQARGEVNVAGESGAIEAHLTTPDLGAVSGIWPQLKGRFTGGVAEGDLAGKFRDGGFTGELKLTSRDGKVIVPDAPEEYSVHPIRTASARLQFEPGRLVVSDARMRGPKGNLDGDLVWVEGGAVTGGGKAWFDRSYSSKLIKPSGWGWLAKLVGIREIKSDFKLSGTSQEVRLNAAITRSLMWKLAKGRVPKEFQQIAAGKTPLWVAPTEVTVVKNAPVELPIPKNEE